MSEDQDFHEFRLSACPDCKHFDFDRVERTGMWTCPAFPHGIPEQIMQGYDRHTARRAGQVGDYVFEPVEDEE